MLVLPSVNRMPSIPSVQAPDETKKERTVPDQQKDSLEISALESDSIILPHDRVGSDFSWLQASSQEDSTVQKAKELEDEESFLYGNEVTGKLGEHSKLQEMGNPALSGHRNHQDKPIFSCLGDLFDMKQTFIKASASKSEKIRNIFESLGPTNISDMMVKAQGVKEEKQPGLPSADPAAVVLPAPSNPNVRQALESLQSLIKGESPARTHDAVSQLSYWTFSHCQGCKGRCAGPACTLTQQIQDYSSVRVL